MADRLFAAAASLALVGGSFAAAEEPPLPPTDVPSAASTDPLDNLRERSSTRRWGGTSRTRRTPPAQVSLPPVVTPRGVTPPANYDSLDASTEPRGRVSRVNAIPIDGPATRRFDDDSEYGDSRDETRPIAPEVLTDNEKSNDAALPPMLDAAFPAPKPPASGESKLDDEGYRRVTSPDQLKKVTEILPFYDYEPDKELAKTDPCRNLCPRPDGCPGREHLCPDEEWHNDDFVPRLFEESLFTWSASNLYHYPLYFEDPALERYGHTWPCHTQPFVSVTRASVQLLALPYQMGIDPICKKKYALGWYRPGDCAPKLCYQPPLSARGAAAQAGVMTGLFFVIP